MTELRLSEIAFSERRWSFVGRARTGDDEVVVKLHKGQPDATWPEVLEGSESRRLARNEFEALRILDSIHSDGVAWARPAALLDEVAVLTEHVGGLIPLERLITTQPQRAAQALSKLGRWLRRFHTERPGLVIDGLHLDNIEVDGRGRVVLFDPNELRAGERVVDLGRLSVYILAQGFNRLILPRSRSAALVRVMLESYGVDDVGREAFHAEASRWARLFEQDLRRAADIKGGRMAAMVGVPAFRLYRTMLEARIEEVARIFETESEREATFASRYGEEGAAATYRRHQDRVGLRGARHGLLARAEIAAVRRALEVAPPRRRILDLPAGAGKLWPLLGTLGVPVVAGDASETMLAQATPTPGVTPEVMDATRIPYEDDAFDVAVCLRLLHRLPGRLRQRVVNELARVSPGGVVMSYAYTGGVYRLRYAAVSRWRGSTAWAPHPVTRLEIEHDLAVAGLELVKVMPVAPLLSNEVVVVARRRGPSTSP